MSCIWDFCSLHWWRRHWQKTGLLEVQTSDTLAEGWNLWLEWNEVCEQFGRQEQAPLAGREAQMLRDDQGRTLGFVRQIARRPAATRRSNKR